MVEVLLGSKEGAVGCYVARDRMKKQSKKVFGG